MKKSDGKATRKSRKSRIAGATKASPAALSQRDAPTYIPLMAASVRADFSGAQTLASMETDDLRLTTDERILIVRQALILIESNYVHLPLKRAMHAIDPVQRLKLLLQELESNPGAYASSDLDFHHELTDIFTSIRDLHTNYLLPAPYSGMSAFLPFIVEDCFENNTCRYIVSHIVPGFEHSTFKKGVELLHWNGVPIARAVHNNAQRFAGSNREARHARGLQTLTTRALGISLPPDEEWVIVGYKTLGDSDAELKFHWTVNAIPPFSGDAAVGVDPKLASAMGIDIEQHLVQRVRAALFAPHAREAGSEVQEKLDRGETLDPLESSMPEVMTASRIVTKHGTFGYVRIRTFSVSPAEIVNEFIRLLSALPARGLIIDVRQNGGGNIRSGEYLLQLLTPRRIEPEPVQFINTPLNLEICRRNGKDSLWTDLSPWSDSVSLALQTGAAFSAGFPISDPAQCNAIGQRYFGPVVLITDALCYSTTDIFAAGFQDHEIGPILGVDRNTGAGGANVWEHRHLMHFVLPGEDSVYRELPKGAGMRVSMRRTLRVGPRSGTPVEDLGVVPEYHRPLTRKDILEDNADLKDAAGKLLKSLPVRALSVVALGGSRSKARLRVSTTGMTRLDIYVGMRPAHSIEPLGPVIEVEVKSKRPDSDFVELQGFDGEKLVARYLVSWREILEEAPSLQARRTAKTASSRAPARRGKAQSSKSRKLHVGSIAVRSMVSPNTGDDAEAAAEAFEPRFGGGALLAGVVETGAIPPWRAAKSLLVLREQVDRIAPNRNRLSDGLIGDGAHETRKSDHNPWVRDGGVGVVTACDITHDAAHGCDAGRIAEAVRASRDSRVKYIIWNRRIANSAAIGAHAPWTWREFKGKNPHTKHVHISVKPEKAAYDSGSAWSL